MIEFWTIEAFRRSLKALLKVRKGVYAGVENEIKNSFRGKSMEDILLNRDMVLARDESVVIKLRLQDTSSRLSRSGGYRLIYLAYREKPKVVFLELYAKRGPMQGLDVSDKEFKYLMNSFDEENNTNVLEPYCIE